MKLVLASTSRYRKSLLERLQLPFSVASPGVDEAPLAGETPVQTALRLAEAKALAVAREHPGAIVIGSDQVAVLDGRVLGKPGNHANAVRQLRDLSGREAVFHTAICVHNAVTGRTSSRVVAYHVAFRRLDEATIERYLAREQPFDCAGSAKSEGLGIALLSSMRGDDPSALVGLPLISLVELLAEHGVRVP